MSDGGQDQPKSVEWLIERLQRLIAEATTALHERFDGAERDAAVQAWRDQLAVQLARYAQAGFLAGSGLTELTPAAQAKVKADIQFQLKYLDNFALEVQGASDWQAGWDARAASYANSVKTSFWRGRTRMLPLPAMPAEGTQCRGNCGCSWEIVVVDADRDDYDCYWKRGKGDSCQTCVVRAAEWNPLRIRGGEIQ